MHNMPHTDEAKRKISLAMKGKCNNPNISEWPKKHKKRSHGEKQWQAKLTEQNVIEIRKLFTTGNYSTQVLGDMFSVKRQTINDVVKERTWRHLL